MSKFNNWFNTFLDEKGLPSESWTITANDGTDHFIDTDVVIETIKGAPSHEQAAIKATIVKIDFANGNVNHFFKHLAGALVNNF